MENLNEFFQYVNEKYGTMGGASIIVKNNKIDQELVYGLGSKEKNTKVDLNTVFRIASVSKLVVATATMTLVEKGILDLDEDISKYLGFEVRNPKFPDKVINLKMIFTQTSSITDGYEAGVDSTYDSGYNQIIFEHENIVPLYDFLNPNGKRWVPETFSNYEPGTHWEYANLGCGIQACIIEKMTGIKFTEYVRQTVLLPLGLDASYDIRDIKNPDIATLYSNHGGKLEITRTKEQFLELYIRDRGLGNNYVGPAGGLFISISDLCKIMMVYMNDGTSPEGVQILKKETMDRMLELVWVGSDHGDYTAKGCQFKCMDTFTTMEKGPVRLYGHFGDAYGLKSFMLFNPHQKTGFVYIINGGLFKYLPGGLCDLHNEVFDKYLDMYYDYNETHHLEFIGGEKTATLDGRTIHLEYTKEYKLGTKNPWFSPKTMIDILSIPTVIDRKIIALDLIEELSKVNLYTYLSKQEGLYVYDLKFEQLENGALKFIIDYKPKQCTPRN